MTIIGLPIAGYCLNMVEIKKYSKKFKSKGIHKKRVAFNMIENNSQMSFYFFCFLMPTLIITRNKIAFFLILTVVILGKAV